MTSRLTIKEVSDPSLLLDENVTPQLRLKIVHALKGEKGDSGATVRVPLTSVTAISALRAIVVENGVARYPNLAAPSDAQRVLGVSATAGMSFDAVLAGEVADASWSWSPGIVWCGADGVLTQSLPPTGWLLEIGRALDATRLIVAIKTPFVRK